MIKNRAILFGAVFLLVLEICLAQSPSFDPTPLSRKAEEVKAQIRAQLAKDTELVRIGEALRDHNLRAMRSGEAIQEIPTEVRAAQERLSYDRSSCISDAPLDRLTQSIAKNCDLQRVSLVCGQDDTPILSYSNSVNSKAYGMMKHPDPKSLLSDIKKMRAELVVKLSQYIESFQSCAKEVEQTLLSSQCLQTYETVFDSATKEVLSRNCTEEAIDRQVEAFSQFIEGPMGLAQYASKIKENHAKRRRTAAGIAQVLYALDEQIKILKETREPASDDEGGD